MHRESGGLQSWSCKELDMTEVTCTHRLTHEAGSNQCPVTTWRGGMGGKMGEGGRGCMDNCGSLMLIHGRGQDNIVKQLAPNKKRKKKNGGTISKGSTRV